MSGLFKNTDVTQSFYLKELGLFAIDPDTNQEILFAYINYGNEAEYINNSISEKKEHYYNMIITVDNAENVEISTNLNTIYVTEKQFDIANTVVIDTITIEKNTATDGVTTPTTLTNNYIVTLPLQYQIRQQLTTNTALRTSVSQRLRLCRSTAMKEN